MARGWNTFSGGSIIQRGDVLPTCKGIGVPAEESDQRKRSKAVIYVEDALILLSIGLLFWLGVLNRRETWAQVAMIPVLGMLLIVLVRRVRRVHRVMRGRK